MKLVKCLRLIILILVIPVFLVRPVFADRQKVVLLISLNTENMHSLFFNYKEYVPELEKFFRYHFSRANYEIETKINADQFDLWRALHEPKNVAVFWLSHASVAGSANMDGLLKSNQIIDVNGYDVTPVFEKIHPNLRFLAVIGCLSEQVMETLPRVSHDPGHPDHPYLRLYTFNHKEDAKEGLKSALMELNKVITIPEIRLGYPASCRQRLGYKVHVSRQFQLRENVMRRRLGVSPIQPAARMMVGKAVVDVFPSASDGQMVQTHEVFIPMEDDTSRPSTLGALTKLPMLRMDVGQNSWFQISPRLTDLLDMGRLNLVLEGADGIPQWQPWSLWRDQQGKPIGVTSHSYVVNPEFSAHPPEMISGSLVRASEFSCEPMPNYYDTGLAR